MDFYKQNLTQFSVLFSVFNHTFLLWPILLIFIYLFIFCFLSLGFTYVNMYSQFLIMFTIGHFHGVIFFFFPKNKITIYDEVIYRTS